MEAAFYVILLYLYVPVVWGILVRNKINNKHHKGVLSYNFIRFKHASYEERFLILLTILLILALPVACHIVYVNPKNETFGTIGSIIAILAMVLSAIYALTSKTVHDVYKKYSGRLNIIIAISATVNFSKATSYADGIISGLIGIRASELPTGMAWLTLIMVPVAWLVTLAIGSIAIYLVALFGSPSIEANRSVLRIPVKRKVFRELAPYYAVAFSFAILAISPLTLVSHILGTDWAETSIREELVDASFHVKAEKCGIEGIEGAKVAYLESGKAVVALPGAKYSYEFETIDCPATWIKPAEIVRRYGKDDTEQQTEETPQ
ncbi:hypothetical protein [Ectopseudomonas khazarica]|uniref:hypothetical protein n=1 Tax=Ectopseudomonas khazarica TaxID=2502979 RepID=UPI0037C70FD5